MVKIKELDIKKRGGGGAGVVIVFGGKYDLRQVVKKNKNKNIKRERESCTVTV